jgi:hypothetical protein
MNIDLKKIMNIKTKDELIKYDLNKPIFYNNYLFHYLIMFNNLDMLKSHTFPVNYFNEENLDGFMLAAKYNHFEILEYLLEKYPKFIYNHNSENLNFINFITQIDKLIIIMKKFNSIDWVSLFKFKNEANIEYYRFFITELKKEDLTWFVHKFDFPKYYLLSAILYNNKISDNDKISIYDEYSVKQINCKDYKNTGLIIDLIKIRNVKLTKYFVEKGIDLEYIFEPVTLFITPFFYLYNICINNNAKASNNLHELIDIIEIIWKHIKLDYKFKNHEGTNYVGMVLNNNNNNQPEVFNIINDNILSISPDYCWNSIDINKETNLFNIIEFPFGKYRHYLENRKLNISVVNRSNQSILDIASGKWKTFFKEFETNTNNNKLSDIEVEINPYQHQTKFTASLFDIVIYFIYLSKKYKNLYIPKITNNYLFTPTLSWFIIYDEKQKELNYQQDLIPMLNSTIKENKYEFGLLFLSIKMNEDLLHANIILYDFKNKTIERFEPYGDDGKTDKLDSILKEVLTHDNDFKYLKPKDFLPKPGYQLLSNENDSSKIKSGDFGGFCLGWCIWYVEHRLRNDDIKPKTLNNKTIEKLLQLDDTLVEYIRNYSNKLYDEKFKIAKDDIKIPEKEISNTNLSMYYEKQILKYASDFFK